MSGSLQLILFGAILVITLIKWPSGLWPVVDKLLPRKKTRNRQGDGLPSVQREAREAEAPLRVEGVGIRFGGLQALENVDMVLEREEFVGLIGPNGAGKSTLFSIISGLERQMTGRVELFGEPLPASHDIVRHGMARTFQHVQLVPGLSVIENVALGTYSRTRTGLARGLFALDGQESRRTLASARVALERFGLEEEADAAVESLPLGTQRIVEIARALVSDPQILLLDEPAAGLRFSEKLMMVKTLRRLKSEGVTIMLVEHDMELVMSCVDRLVVLDRGRIIANGSPKDVQADPKVAKAYLGNADHAPNGDPEQSTSAYEVG